jgi:tetratricopeptide (TPR) repeat protein
MMHHVLRYTGGAMTDGKSSSWRLVSHDGLPGTALFVLPLAVAAASTLVLAVTVASGGSRMDISLLTIYLVPTVVVSVRAWAGRRALQPLGTAPVTRDYVVPAELPPVPYTFVGREAEIEEILRYFAGSAATGPAVVLIQGPDGIGKTSLAVRVAHHLADRYPDGQLFVDLGRTPASDPFAAGRNDDQLVEDGTQSLVRALYRPGDAVPVTREDWYRRYRERIYGRRAMIVFDEADSTDVVNALLPDESKCAVVITSRVYLSGLRINPHVIELDALSQNESLALLKKVVPPKKVDDEIEEARAIVDRTGGHPRAVQLTATSLAVRPDTKLAALRTIVASDLRWMSASRSEATSMDLSYALLTDEEQTAIQVLALLPRRTFSTWMLSSLMRVEEATASQVIERLMLVGLVARSSDDAADLPVFRVDDPVRRYARARLGETTRPQDRQRLLSAVSERGEQRRGHRENLVHHVYKPLAAGQLSAALQGARTAIALARETQSPVAEGMALAAMAEVRAELGNFDASEDLARAALRGEMSSGYSRARALRCLGRINRTRYRAGEAIRYLEEARTESKAIPDVSEEVRVLCELALAQSATSPTTALDTLTEAAELCRSRPDGGEQHMAGLLWAKSVAYQEEGSLQAAADCLDVAEHTAILLDQRLWLGWINHRRALLAFKQREFNEARSYAMEAVDLFSQIGHRYGTGHATLAIGRAHVAERSLREAVPPLEEALESFVNCGDRWWEASAALNLGWAYDELHDERAASLVAAALGLFEQVGDVGNADVAAVRLAGLRDRTGQRATTSARITMRTALPGTPR